MAKTINNCVKQRRVIQETVCSVDKSAPHKKKKNK